MSRNLHRIRPGQCSLQGDKISEGVKVDKSPLWRATTWRSRTKVGSEEDISECLLSSARNDHVTGYRMAFRTGRSETVRVWGVWLRTVGARWVWRIFCGTTQSDSESESACLLWLEFVTKGSVCGSWAVKGRSSEQQASLAKTHWDIEGQLDIGAEASDWVSRSHLSANQFDTSTCTHTMCTLSIPDQWYRPWTKILTTLFPSSEGYFLALKRRTTAKALILIMDFITHCSCHWGKRSVQGKVQGVLDFCHRSVLSSWFE